MQDIYEYIDGIKITNDADFLNFVTTLTNYFSKQLGIENCSVKCKVELLNLDLKRSSFKGNVTPAECRPKLQDRKLVGCYITFDPALAKQGRIARIIKLTAHEWMHYFDNLAKARVIKIENVNIGYQDLLNKSRKFASPQMRKEILDKKTYDCLLKLSPPEVLADLHAQNVLKDILQHSKNDILKKDIITQIENYDKQISEHKQYLKDHNFEEYDYNNLKRWQESVSK